MWMDHKKVICTWKFYTEERSKYRFPGRGNWVNITEEGVTELQLSTPPTNFTAPTSLQVLHPFFFLRMFKVKSPHFLKSKILKVIEGIKKLPREAFHRGIR
jgi:hypothetical protein